jgi:hypothetical protein
MATNTQSTSPTVFMPRLETHLARLLKIDPATVRTGVDETGEQKPHRTPTDTALLLVLTNAHPTNVNAGAGRKATPLTRDLVVKVRTRGGSDIAGEDKIALNEHWALQDKVMNALLVLPHTAENYTGMDANDDRRMPFLTPIKYVGGGQDVKRVKDSAGVYESVMTFRITYSPEVDLP